MIMMMSRTATFLFAVFCSLVLVFVTKTETAPLKNVASTSMMSSSSTTFPRFMEELYNKVLTGKRRLLDIVHSNEAIEVRTSNSSFEATFIDLSFVQREVLKDAKLRLNFPTFNNCIRDLTLRIFDGNSLQLLDQQKPRVFMQHDVIFVPLTRPLKKFRLAHQSPRESLLVRIDFPKSTAVGQPCVGNMNNTSWNAYLVSHTKETDRSRRYSESLRDDADTFRQDSDDSFRPEGDNSQQGSEDFQTDTGNFREGSDTLRVFDDVSRSQSNSPRNDSDKSTRMTYHDVVKRNAPSKSKVCHARTVYVNLSFANSSIALPQGFHTTVCGTWQPIPIGADPTVKAVAAAIHAAVKNLPKINDPACCVPISYQKLPLLYLDGKKHVVLRYLDRIHVTKCGCV